MSRRLLAGVATAALTFGLVACGDGGDGPVTTPPPDIGIDAPSDGGGGDPSDGGGSASSDGGGDSAAAAPDIPAPDPADYPGMDQNTPEGAEQAFRYYIAVVYWSHASGDTSTLSRLYSESCGSCIDFESEVVKLKEKSGLWSLPTITDVGIKSQDAENFDIEVGYSFELGPHERPLELTGNTSNAPTKMTAVAGLNWNGDSWRVNGMQIDVSQYN